MSEKVSEGTYANDVEAFGGCSPFGHPVPSVGRKLKINHFSFHSTMANNNSGLVATCFGSFLKRLRG